MSDEPSPTTDPFDLDRLQQLLELMEKHQLREVKLKRADQVWILRRGPAENSLPLPVSYAPPPGPVVTMPPPAAASAAPPPAEPVATGSGTFVKSPTVGTFYSAPQPGDPPFVKVGDKVQRDTVVCLIEAMKFFNPVHAEVSGTVVKILVNEGDPVEYGQPLFQVQPE